MDDRTPRENDPGNEEFLPRSRYGPISYFISESEKMKNSYNDLKFKVNEEIMKFATEKAEEIGISVDENLL